MTRLWLLRDAWRNEQEFTGTEVEASIEAQRLAKARGVAVIYKAKLVHSLSPTEAPTARMKRP